MNYTIKEHKFRFAAWASSRAAGTSPLCRFKVNQGIEILLNSGLLDYVDNVELLPEDKSDMDCFHEKMRENIISEAGKLGLDFTHGVAAKLLNMYFKIIFICGGHEVNKKVGYLHPPIDAVLLDSLKINNVGGLKKEWNKSAKIRWSKFTSNDYQNVINNIKLVVKDDKPLWVIENYWQGYQ